MPPVPVSLGPLARALALANIIAVIAAAVASAQHPVTGIGFAKVLGSNNIRVTSFDHKWTVGALGSHYAIFDSAGQPLFMWEPETFYHESVSVSFSPDSKHVVVMDQQPRAAQFFCAELGDGQWHNVPLPLLYRGPEGEQTSDPKQPPHARVDKVELGDWISLTEINIMKSVLADTPPSGSQRFDYTLILSFENSEALER